MGYSHRFGGKVFEEQPILVGDPLPFLMPLADSHLGTMAQHAYVHGSHFRGGAGFGPGVDTNGMFFGVPVDHHLLVPIAQAPSAA